VEVTDFSAVSLLWWDPDQIAVAGGVYLGVIRIKGLGDLDE